MWFGAFAARELAMVRCRFRLLWWCAWLALAAGFFERGTDVHALRSTNDFKRWVTNSSYLVMLAFYREGCGYCQLLVDPWEKAASDLKHMVHFCGLDTEKDPKLTQRAAQKYGIEIKGVPTIVAFTPKSKNPIPYNGERTAAAIKAFASSTMPDFVVRLKPEGYEAWADYSTDPTRRIVLFSEKGSPAALLKAISSEFRGRVLFGLAPKASFEALAQRFGVSGYPTLVALRRPADDLEDDSWISGHFGDRQFALLQLSADAKPTFRTLESWLMPFARAPRASRAKVRARRRTATGGEL